VADDRHARNELDVAQALDLVGLQSDACGVVAVACALVLGEIG
jgi:hypothetical protein